MFSQSEYIKKVCNILKEYKLLNSSWSDIMKSGEVPLEIKYFINGARFIYMNSMIDHIKKTGKDIIIYPTGSNKLSSDKDIQISIDIEKYSTIDTIKSIVRNIVKVIQFANKQWKQNNIEYLLDIHFYPPTLLNHIPLKSKNGKNKYILVGKSTDNRTLPIVFVPQLSNETLVNNFQKSELKLLEKNTKEDTHKYYSRYVPDVANCLNELICCYQGKIKMSPQEFNERLFCLVNYNNIGPEMYLSISSIIIVVWHLQMGNKLSQKLLRCFAPVAYKENLAMYRQSKKDKYKKRYEYCRKFM